MRDPGTPGCVVWQCLAGCVTVSCHWGAGQWGGSETTGLCWDSLLCLWRKWGKGQTGQWVQESNAIFTKINVKENCSPLIWISQNRWADFTVEKQKKQTNMFAIFLFDSEDLVITCVQLCKAMEKNMWEENKFKNPQMIYLHKQKILTTDFQLSPVWLLPICCLLTGHNCVHPPGIRRVIFFLGHSYNTREIIYILIHQQLKVY